MTWAHRPFGYHLLCNRDEKLTRRAALAPAVIEREGVRFVAPVDPDGGGTWLAVNEFGVTVCLLNGGPDSLRRQRGRSRGLLVRDLACAKSSAECSRRLRQLDLVAFAPFTTVILEPDRPTTVADWDGLSLSLDSDGDARMPLTSSSHDAAGVRRFRLSHFDLHVRRAGQIDPALLYRFHASHGSSPGAYSPCMHRQDAETVSFSWIAVAREHIHFRYHPASPCRHHSHEQQILLRAA